MASGSASETWTMREPRRARAENASSNAIKASSNSPISRTDPGPTELSSASPTRAGSESLERFLASRSKLIALLMMLFFYMNNKAWLFKCYLFIIQGIICTVITGRHWRIVAARLDRPSTIRGWKRSLGSCWLSAFPTPLVCWDTVSSHGGNQSRLLMILTRELKNLNCNI